MEWVSGLYAAVATLGASRVVRQGGPGELVDLAIAEGREHHPNAAADLINSVPRPPESRHARPQLRDAVDRADVRRLGVGFDANTRTQFDSFLLMIERPDLIEDGYWASIAHRVMNWEEWNGIIHAWTTKHTTAEVVALAAELQIPGGPGVRRPHGRRARTSRCTRILDRRSEWAVPGAPAIVAHRRRRFTATAAGAAPGGAHGRGRAPSPEGAHDPRPHAPAARGEGPRPHRLVGGPVGVGHARRARRRRGARGIGHPTRRHALHQRGEHGSPQLVGLRARSSTSRTPTSVTSPSTSRARRNGNSRYAWSSSATSCSNYTPRVIEQFDLGWDVVHAEPAGGDGAHAGVRPRRSVARPARVRADHGTGHRARAAHRPRRRPAVYPAGAVRSQRGHARSRRRARRPRGA